ncbi:MAG TPA: NAD(P)H-dependent oxidoreductase [Candidatus Aphodoplasma excrementigallinarum]|uniref:NAD(P)H-dependent oxidoreductase n=1 Tax=Candidatus Aphodoplasma excrementigallinarum TaxID=2840673 RepID=A0A9D1SZZ7_9FIRM|nr:NAD(P)H-dependent oxidoreductase [Candidatus Aphodoplasma excrementigallinarum]
MMPIRFIAECFGFAVDWNAEQQTITITKSAQAGDPSPVPTASPTPTETPDASSSALVVYFSATGNTEALAEKIAQAAGADLYEIVPEVPYTSEDLNYDNDGCRANQELNSDARPAIQPLPVDAAQYDTIILGYPIWWGQCPPPVRTFLESYDFSGKTIMPFCTSGSSGISGSLSKIRELCPDSTITEGFRGTASTTEEQIDTWLDENGFTGRVQMLRKPRV